MLYFFYLRYFNFLKNKEFSIFFNFYDRKVVKNKKLFYNPNLNTF